MADTQECLHLGYCPYKDQPSGPLTPQLARSAVAIILAGGRGSRLGPLTDWEAKPAIPFGGKFRIIDFTLSNCVNSGIRKIGIATQYKSQSLIRHVQRGWSFLDGRFDEFVELMPAQQRVTAAWYKGTADAVFQNLDLLRHQQPSLVLILAGDHVYKMDYTKLLAEHVSRQAELTVPCVEVPVAGASEFGVMEVDESMHIVGFQEKPADPRPMPGRPDVALASMGIYCFDAHVLYDELLRDSVDVQSKNDFGGNIIPHMVAAGRRVFAHSFVDSCVNMSRGLPYWRDVGTIDAFWAANIDLTRITPDLNLYDDDWPIWTYQEQRPPAKFVFDEDGRRGEAVDSLVSGGCIVSGGTVRNSLLFTNVRVHSYAAIDESVLLPDVDVGRRTRLRRCLVESQARLPEGFAAGFDPVEDRKRFHVTPGGITLITPEMLGQQLHHLA